MTDRDEALGTSGGLRIPDVALSCQVQGPGSWPGPDD
jgi:hypothetical protein